jgi:hypothetical protein
MAESGSRKRITIHADGGCNGNPGPGGWAALLRYGNHLHELTGGEPASVKPKPEARNPRQTRRANGAMLGTPQGEVVLAFPQWCFGFVQNFWLPPSAVMLRRTGRSSDWIPGAWWSSPEAALTPGNSEYCWRDWWRFCYDSNTLAQFGGGKPAPQKAGA